jgi:ligand-binding sensor domain-containing protein
VLDTIPVALPNEKQDSIGVLSDIIELDSMNLVVALKGYKSQNFDGDSIAVIRGGIIRTTDRGATWKRADMPAADQAYYSMQQLKSCAMLAVSVDAAILTDTATKSSAVRCYSGNILRSSDEGATWTTQKSFVLNNQTLTKCTWRIWQGNERIYVATPEAVMISTDDGQTWTAVNEFPLNCIINGVAEYKGQLYVATTMGIYRENASTSITDQGTRDQPAIQASATHSGQAWRITVTGLPTSRITGIDVYDIQGRQHQTEQLWSQDNTASITSPLPSNGIYGVVVHGPNGQRWTTAVGVFE